MGRWVELIVRKFWRRLKARRQKDRAEGAAFDPNFHEAISSEITRISRADK